MRLSAGLTTNSRKLKKVAAVIPLFKAEVPTNDWGVLRNIEYIPVTKALLADIVTVPTPTVHHGDLSIFQRLK